MPARPALAHARLEASEPAVGAEGAAPAQVVLHFTEAVEPRFSSIMVSNSAGLRMEMGPAHLASEPRQLAVALKPLVPGEYRVDWVAISVDTHRTQGSFHFSVVR